MKHLRTWRPCRRILIPLLVLVLTVLLAAGCGGRKGASGGEAGNTPQETVSANTSADRGSGGAGEGAESGGQDAEEEYTEETDVAEEDEPDAADADRDPDKDGTDADEEADLPDPDGTYTGAEEVALYLHTYGTLPPNFMTKKEARKLGWEGGSLERFAPGMCIGGDRFGNYEGVLPEGNYHECDINTLGKSKRGAERLVFDDRGNIYYTDDHYETFTLLYGGE